MKTVKRLEMAMLGVVGCLTLGVWGDEVSVCDVVVCQRWPWSRLVDIEYVLSCDPALKRDITVRGYDGAERLAIPDDALSGDLHNVSCGARRIVWNPVKSGHTNVPLSRVRVELAPLVPVYMIVDLTLPAGASNQVVYVTGADLAGGAYGTVVTNPVTNVVSVAWTGVTNDDCYATDKLVLRRVSAGSFAMGSADPPNTPVTLTKDFYVSVFPVTQKQWNHVMGNWPSYFTNTVYRETRPVEYVSYNDVRGATNDDPVISWPATDCAVSPASFLGRLRLKTGISGFDLPTEAQWEYVCRAGTTTYYNDGLAKPAVLTSNEQMNVLGRYYFNHNAALADNRNVSSQHGTAEVGSYRPNAWGLYDTLGNVWEWCRDWWAVSVAGGTDPQGANPGTCRVKRGGNWGCQGNVTGSGVSRNSNMTDMDPTNIGRGAGFRIVITLP